MIRGIKRKRASSNPSSSSAGPSSSSSKTHYAASVSPSRTFDVKPKIPKNLENLSFEELLENITLEDSTQAFLPFDLEPSDEHLSSSDEQEDMKQFDRMPILMSPSPPPVDPSDEEDGDYEIEKILLKNNDSPYYFVKWLGYDINQTSWEVSWNLHNCEKVMKKFQERQEICYEIYKSLQMKDEYQGYIDIWINGVITRTFIETSLLEDILTKFCKTNKLGDFYVENWTRTVETYPQFTYIAENILSEKATHVLENANAFVRPCKCDDICGKKSQHCSCIKFSPSANGYLYSDKYPYIMECNKYCKCTEKCRGKVFKRGRTIPVMLFKTHYCGWGLRTLVFIPNNKFVVEYVGHIKLHSECIEIKDQTYLLDIDSENGKNIFVVDATNEGNSSRFINHSCDPNLEVVLVKGYYNPNIIARVAFFSIREIQPGEELTFNYFKHTPDLDNIDQTNPPPECFCGYEHCRKYLI